MTEPIVYRGVPVSPERTVEENERPERIKRLGVLIELLFPGEGEQHAALRQKIKTSLDVPQWGAYHNEGMYMDAHLDLILRNLEALKKERFPLEMADIPDEIKQTMIAVANVDQET